MNERERTMTSREVISHLQAHGVTLSEPLLDMMAEAGFRAETVAALRQGLDELAREGLGLAG